MPGCVGAPGHNAISHLTIDLDHLLNVGITRVLSSYQKGFDKSTFGEGAQHLIRYCDPEQLQSTVSRLWCWKLVYLQFTGFRP